MEPSSYQLTPVACSQRSRAGEKEAEERGRKEWRGGLKQDTGLGCDG